MSTPIEELRGQLADASTEAVDDQAQAHIESALEVLDDLTGPELIECPVCGRMGLPERILIKTAVVARLADRTPTR